MGLKDLGNLLFRKQKGAGKSLSACCKSGKSTCKKRCYHAKCFNPASKTSE